jgi:hypothetical protein
MLYPMVAMPSQFNLAYFARMLRGKKEACLTFFSKEGKINEEGAVYGCRGHAFQSWVITRSFLLPIGVALRAHEVGGIDDHDESFLPFPRLLLLPDAEERSPPPFDAPLTEGHLFFIRVAIRPSTTKSIRCPELVLRTEG